MGLSENKSVKCPTRHKQLTTYERSYIGAGIHHHRCLTIFSGISHTHRKSPLRQFGKTCRSRLPAVAPFRLTTSASSSPFGGKREISSKMGSHPSTPHAKLQSSISLPDRQNKGSQAFRNSSSIMARSAETPDTEETERGVPYRAWVTGPTRPIRRMLSHWDVSSRAPANETTLLKIPTP